MGTIPTDLTPAEVQKKINEVTEELCALLCAKNAAYGNSALAPKRVFAKGIDAMAQLKVRADDKLSRISNGSVCHNDLMDLAGYLVLMVIALGYDEDAGA